MNVLAHMLESTDRKPKVIDTTVDYDDLCIDIG